MDDYLEIGRQFGVFLRRADRFYCDLKGGGGLDLERAAYMLLGRIVSGPPARLSTLAEELGLDLSTVSRQVAALQTAGLVARTTDAEDRRASLIAATEIGDEVYSRNRDIWKAALKELLDDWSPDERAEFARLFGRFNDAIATRHEAAPHSPMTHAPR